MSGALAMQATPAAERPRLPLAGALGLAALCVGVLALCAGAADGPSALVRVPDGRFAGWLAGPLSELEAGSPSRAAFAVALCVMVAGYLLAVRHAKALGPRAVLGAVAALHAIVLLAPPLLTTDIFSYIAYGRLGALHGIDPYVGAPILAPHDAVYPWVGWHHARSVYGPLFTLLTYPLAAVGVAPAVWTLKAIAAAASLGCVALVWRAAPARGIDPVRAAAIVGLSPVLLLYAVGGAHNDLLMMLAMTGAVVLTLGARDRAAGAAVIAGAAVKAAAIVLLPFLLAGARRPLRALTGTAVAVGAVALIAVVAFGSSAGAFVTLLAHQQQAASAASVPSLAGRLVGGAALPGLLLAGKVVALLSVGGLLVATRRGLDWVTCAALALVAVTATTGWLMPWYTVWALPLAALALRREALWGVYGVQAVLLGQVLAGLLGP